MPDNTFTTLIASGSHAATAAVTSRAVTNTRYRGGHIAVRVTATTGTAITPKVQGLVPGTTGTWYDVLSGTAITSTGVTVLKVYPGIAASAGAAASDVLPRVFRVSVTQASTKTTAYSVAAGLVV